MKPYIMNEFALEHLVSTPSSLDGIIENRRIHLMGRLQQFVSHEVMNSLTRAIINLDSGEITKSKAAIYQSATALQELQLLGDSDSLIQTRKIKINDVLKNAVSLTAGMCRHYDILIFSDLKDSSDIMARGQAQLVAMLEILISTAQSLVRSDHRSLFMNALSFGSFVRFNFIASGANIDFKVLELSDIRGIGLSKKIIELDKGSCWIERDSSSYRICVQYPKI